MDRTNKENLISGLASTFGLDTERLKDNKESYFDSSTGTLYCNDMIISKNVADEACQYFESMERQCLSGINQNKKLAMFYRCAIEAISMMETNEVKELAKHIVK